MPVTNCSKACQHDKFMYHFRQQIAQMNSCDLAINMRGYLSCCSKNKKNAALQEFHRRLSRDNRNAVILFFANFVLVPLWDHRAHQWLRNFYCNIILGSGKVAENTGPVLDMIKLLVENDPKNRIGFDLDLSQLRWVEESHRPELFPHLLRYTKQKKARAA